MTTSDHTHSKAVTYKESAFRFYADRRPQSEVSAGLALVGAVLLIATLAPLAVLAS